MAKAQEKLSKDNPKSNEKEGPSDGTNPDVGPPQEKKYETMDAYFTDLQIWLNQAYMWQQATSAFIYYLMCYQHASQGPSPQFPNPFPTPPSTSNTAAPETPRAPDPGINGVVCRVPSLWRRVGAELIDFMLLFFLKLGVTFVTVNFFNVIDLDDIDMGVFQKDGKMEYKTVLQMTFDIFILELVHRIVVCGFETFWLLGGFNGQIGGATPGKRMLKLRVIKCESSTSLEDREDMVIVRPGTNLGFGTSFFRASVKNVALTFFIPASFAFVYFQHNRTAYDMVCKTIVVEEPIVPHRPHQD